MAFRAGPEPTADQAEMLPFRFLKLSGKASPRLCTRSLDLRPFRSVSLQPASSALPGQQRHLLGRPWGTGARGAVPTWEPRSHGGVPCPLSLRGSRVLSGPLPSWERTRHPELGRETHRSLRAAASVGAGCLLATLTVQWGQTPAEGPPSCLAVASLRR